MKNKIEKLKRFSIKHDESFFIIIFLIMISGYIFNISTCVGDEVWNFQNIYKMYNGYKIYIDANVITTPLFHFIGFILFRILGANFFIFRVYNMIICLLLFFMVYKIFKTFKLKKYEALFLTSILFCIEKDIILMTANYNILALVLVLCAIFVILNKEKLKHYYFYEALFIVLIILTKQNIGLFYMIGYIIYIIINKVECKNNIKIFSYIFLILLVFVFILFKYGILNGFISYCILGIGEFARENNFSSVSDVIIMIIVSYANISLIIYLHSNDKNIIVIEEKRYINTLSCFAYLLLFLTYPIFNSAHIRIAMFIQYMLLLYIIYLFIKKNKSIKNLKNIIVIINIGIITFFSVFSMRYLLEYFYKINNDEYTYENIYFGTLFDKDSKLKIESVTKYIEENEKDVIILSSKAAIYMMPINRSNGAMDLPLLGNLGKDGEGGIIKEISNLKNTQILIDKEKYTWQDSDNIINYVRNNLLYIGEIEDMLIYETK